jgi:hypothetical protein
VRSQHPFSAGTSIPGLLGRPVRRTEARPRHRMAVVDRHAPVLGWLAVLAAIFLVAVVLLGVVNLLEK